jgi:alcohol dehydrogenase, propanol-preferring
MAKAAVVHDFGARLHELGRTRVLYETRRLEQVNEAFREVEEGTAGTARLVFQF